MRFKWIVWATLTASLSSFGLAQTGTAVKHIQTETAVIASAVWAGDTLFVSGQLPSPIVPADRQKGTPAVYGDTGTQAGSALSKIEALLQEQGLASTGTASCTPWLLSLPPI